MSLDVVKLLAELISIPSVNPMGRQVEGDIYYEHRVTDYLEQLFKRLRIPYERQLVDPGRENIVARLDGAVSCERGGPLVVWEAHQDTVPVDGMTIEPWTPTVRDGRIYGRGSCDIKGGMAAMLVAFARLAEERPKNLPTILMACTVNEEHGYTGATALAKQWAEPKPGALIPRRPDCSVVAEPTELQVVVAHKGTARWRAHTLGRAAHSSNPQLGDNAIYKMARLLLALEEYAEHELPKVPVHPRCGRPTLSVGLINGGISVNTVADRCTIEIDRRVIPGETPQAAYLEVIDYVSRHGAVNFPVQHDTMFLQGVPLNDTENGAVAERLSAVARRLTKQGEIVGVAYGTDASKFAATGVPSIVYGPGSVAQAHTCDEWLAIDELHQATEVLYEFGRGGG
ncbi:MAG: M20 family metallopeptidase [Planctomycetes bacterium]|nr:M20 family metallopeptidase [Planctomycetota bacterium]